MTVAVIHDDDGKITILRSGRESGVRIDAEATGQPYVITEDEVDVEQHYVRVSTDEIVAYPARPSEAHVFNYSTETWELDLDIAKSQKWDELKIDRDDQEFGAFTWNGWEFDADEDSQARINAAVQAAILDDTYTATWTLADNTKQALTATQLKEVGKALGNHIKAAHDRGRIVRSLVDSATSTQDLEAISW